MRWKERESEGLRLCLPIACYRVKSVLIGLFHGLDSQFFSNRQLIMRKCRIFVYIVIVNRNNILQKISMFLAGCKLQSIKLRNQHWILEILFGCYDDIEFIRKYFLMALDNCWHLRKAVVYITENSRYKDQWAHGNCMRLPLGGNNLL